MKLEIKSGELRVWGRTRQIVRVAGRSASAALLHRYQCVAAKKSLLRGRCVVALQQLHDDDSAC